MKEQAAKQTPATAPRKVLILLDNLFFAAKINQAAARVNISPIYAKTPAQALAIALTERPSLIVLDLDEAKCAPLEFLAQLKANTELRAIPTLGFVSHVNTGLQQQAREAGCGRLISRSAFDRNLATILSQNS